MNVSYRWILLLAAGSLGSCGSADRAAPSAQREANWSEEKVAAAAPAMDAPPPPPPPPGAVGGARGAVERDEGGDADGYMALEPAPEDAKKGGDDQAGPAVRAWFPESFVWAPLLETNAEGLATLPVTVPDTLTTWRVLALAQSTRGGQGGALTTFTSSMPAYVDVVAPRFLYAGDRAELPVQVVNQTADPLRSALQVQVSGGTGAAGGGVSLEAWGSTQAPVSVTTTLPGTLLVRATLGELDAVERSVLVRPVGRPVELAFGGTLAGPRSFPVEAVPGGRYGTLELTVFPGALAVLDRELGLASGRGGGLHASAYAWALAREGRALVGKSAWTELVLRDAGVRAWQRLVRATRSPDASTAAVVVVGLVDAAPETLEGRLHARLRDQLADEQQLDGLWGQPDGARLDEVLIHTARCAFALADDGATLRAQGAMERYADRLRDPVVAAWALAAGIVEPGAVEDVRKRVAAAVVSRADGSKVLPGGKGVSTGEATALAALVLEAERADLAAGLLGQWSPFTGFGPGWANLVALRAVKVALGGEVPANVAVSLYVDGAQVGTATLDPRQPHVPITLLAPGVRGAQTVEVRAEPAVPGLAFTLQSRTYVPWVATAPQGLDLVVTPPASPRVGVEDRLAVQVAGPAGAIADVDLGLPAGVTVDKAALASALGDGTSFLVEDGAVHLYGLALPGGRREVVVPVQATLAGSFSSGPSVVSLGGESWTRVPDTWTVR